jgi:hypothetical protein
VRRFGAIQISQAGLLACAAGLLVLALHAITGSYRSFPKPK